MSERDWTTYFEHVNYSIMNSRINKIRKDSYNLVLNKHENLHCDSEHDTHTSSKTMKANDLHAQFGYANYLALIIARFISVVGEVLAHNSFI